MATWLALAVCAQLLLAVSLLIDRQIVVRAQHIGKPIVYAFYTALLSGVVIVIAPFGLVSLPNEHVLIHSLIQAATFTTGLYFLYSALQVTRASDAAPVIGAVSAVTSLILAGIFLEGDITGGLVLPVLLLAAGTALISHFHFTQKAMYYTLLAGLMFGVAIFVFKLVVNEVPFIDGFFWTRTMSLVVALALLVVPPFRKAILKGSKHSTQKSKLLVLGNKAIASVAGIMTSLAVSLGSVSIINALAGLQFAFLYAFALLFGKKMPELPGGVAHGHGGWQTAVGVVLIITGIAVIVM
jgi:uncharacterized membrane protein